MKQNSATSDSIYNRKVLNVTYVERVNDGWEEIFGESSDKQKDSNKMRLNKQNGSQADL